MNSNQEELEAKLGEIADSVVPNVQYNEDGVFDEDAYKNADPLDAHDAYLKAWSKQVDMDILALKGNTGAFKEIPYPDGDPLVNHPDHYTRGNHEVIEVIKAKYEDTDLDPFVGYLLGNVTKYLLRCAHKGKLLQDLEKAQWYLNRTIEELKDAE